MEAVIGGGLNAFNDAVTGQADRQPVAVVARDPGTGAILGGATGRSSLGLLFLDLFYLPPECRGAGLSRAILQAFEAEGRRRGCVAAVLYTISFQAPGFYEKQGYVEFARLPYPPKGERLFLRKRLTEDAP